MSAVFDSHCHLDDPRFDADRDAVLARAEVVGVDHIVVPGITAATWHRTRRICAASTPARPALHPAYGLHPYFVAQHQPSDLDALRDWVRTERPVAVGECGLDHYIRELDQRRQRDYFDAQLAIAAEFDLPVIVHARRAVDEVIAALRRYPGVRADVHSFAGSAVQARRLVELGALLGIGASVRFERARRLRTIVAELPLTCLLVETDAPDQPGPERRGERNEPAFVTEVIATLAELRGVDRETIAAQTRQNALELFKLDD